MIARILIFLVLAGTAFAALQDRLKALDRIGIHQDDDGARLVHAGTKAPFFVKGFNYVLHRL